MRTSHVESARRRRVRPIAAGLVLLAASTLFGGPPRTTLAAGLSVDLDQWASLERA